MSAITTHVLDLSRGMPAAGVGVTLELNVPQLGWKIIAQRMTDADGRVRDLLPAGGADAGRYRLSFATGEYFAFHGVLSFHPQVIVEFQVRDPKEHHHVPLLLSPFGYSTYRGS